MRRLIAVVAVVFLLVVVVLDLSGIAPGTAVQALPLLVLLGAGILLMRAVWPGREAASQHMLDVPLEQARAASLDVRFGAGDLRLSGGTTANSLLTGTCVGAAREQVSRAEGVARVTVRQPFSLFGRGHADWQLALAKGVPWTEVKLTIGASKTSLDLDGLSVESLVLEAGGTTLDARLARRGQVSLEVSGGHAVLHVPPGVPARIVNDIRLGQVTIDPASFTAEDTAQTRWHTPSAEAETAALIITLKGGLGTVDVVSD